VPPSPVGYPTGSDFTSRRVGETPGGKADSNCSETNTRGGRLSGRALKIKYIKLGTGVVGILA
jgi:hypothetical protein